MIQDTIVALSTSLAMQAVSIIRLSGYQAIEIAEKLCRCELSERDHEVLFRHAYDPFTHEMTDEVILLIMKGPKSFTREDVVEIQCHGGVYVTEKILSYCLALGARHALRGEFSARAVMNGRLNLAQAEAMNELILANSEQSARLAILGLKNNLGHLINPLLEDLLAIIAQIEVNIDYPEYDAEEVTRDILKPLCTDFKKRLENILEESKLGQVMKDGVKTAIVGRPNAGKSSLLNALLKEDKAIVTDIPGTTRDVVEGQLRLKNVLLNLLDTAGLRESSDVVERLGIDKSYKMMKDADLVILLLDASEAINEEEQKIIDEIEADRLIVVYNKSDLSSNPKRLEISALNEDVQPLIDDINQRFEGHQRVFKEPILSTQRTIGLVSQALLAIDQSLVAIENAYEIDLVTIDLKEAYTALYSIQYDENELDITSELFSRFCLGK